MASGTNLNQMILVRIGKQLAEILEKKKKTGQRIGFVPTMGALHAGHLELLKKAKADCDIVVCSIFINPTQFNDPEDFKKYPVTIEADILLLEKAGCDILFLPAVDEVYKKGIDNLKQYELGFIETILEGKFRPGHFQGVCQVVHRLLQNVLPHILFLGQKDYQQCMVLKKLLVLTQLQDTISINILPTVREKDGLAMSSRNLRLSEEARKLAPLLPAALVQLKENLKAGNTKEQIQPAVTRLNEAGFKTEYIELANAETLEIITNWDGKQKAVLLTAAFIDGVRLIDNIIIN